MKWAPERGKKPEEREPMTWRRIKSGEGKRKKAATGEESAYNLATKGGGGTNWHGIVRGGSLGKGIAGTDRLFATQYESRG